MVDLEVLGLLVACLCHELLIILYNTVGKMERFMVDLEVLGLLVACLCHDLDHRGTNNAYQTKVPVFLGQIYSNNSVA